MEDCHTPARPSHYRVLALGRQYKKIIMVLADLLFLPLALWSGYALRLAEWWPTSYLEPALLLFIIMPVIGVLIFMRLGLYRAVVRFMGAQAIFAVIKGVVLLAVFIWISAIVLGIEPFPRSVPINFALAALAYVGGSRLLVRNYYHWLLRNYAEKDPVLIYGAGGSGVQLATALVGGAEYVPIGFLDDDPSLIKSTVAGLPVFKLPDLDRLIEFKGVTHVLLALPSVDKAKKKQILSSLADFPVHVKTMPSLPEMVNGEIVDQLRDVEPEDLLGRESVPPNLALIAKSIAGKAVMVSGAGGSIGSEICRQVLANDPVAIVLYELNEFSLYSIERELTELILDRGLNVSLYPVLGSVLDAERVDRVIKRFGINTIYHAAAYKHVPMVEHNIFQGVRNNAFGTKVMAEAALENSVERFVLISTDKAVRPTNVMGATKRLAELVLQDMSIRSTDTIFSMVRFGNVLGSSGSVVPLFREQIYAGGPVTVTHSEITRFFMTIPEAASLVIQAGSMAKGGDVFVLDMGEPVKITELAEQMIRLMGKEVKGSEYPDGIEIAYSGLRPGEKLYEELLIGGDVVGSEHPKIMRAHEEKLPSRQLEKILCDMELAHKRNDVHKGRLLLEQAVTGFSPSSPVVDWLTQEDLSTKSLH